jgi:hypothetical protein
MALMIRNFGLIAILLLTFSASISLVTAQDVSSGDNSSATQYDTSAASASVQGIWKASLGETEIIIAVSQSAQSLFGLAKFEGDNPWNGAVAGSVSANEVSLSLAAFDSLALASIYISAALDGETMKGFFVRLDSTGKASKGEFIANRISPDTSGYSPIEVTAAPLSTDETVQVEKEQTTELPVSEESEKTALPESVSRFKDVTKLAKGINPDILPRMAAL